MTWLLTLWSKIKLYAAALLAVLVAIGSAWLWGKERGKSAQKQTDTLDADKQVIVAQQQVTAAQEVVKDVQTKVDLEPVSPTEPVATADPSTAAGKLRVDGWVRD